MKFKPSFTRMSFATALTLSLSSSHASASSDAAWDALKTEVTQKCLDRFKTSAGPNVKDAKILLDVMGAQNFITGLIRYTEPRAKKTVVMNCTYDKAQKAVVELFELPDLDVKANWQVLKASK